MNTKLILVEGLPGFGKSTTAELIREILSEQGIENELFTEGNLDHPADYDGVAFYTEEEFKELISSNEQHATLILDNAVKKNMGYFVPYKKMDGTENLLSDDLYLLFMKNDIYELPMDIHIPLLTANWNEFAVNAQADGKTYIFECCFIQNPVTIGMVKNNEDTELVKEYIRQLNDAMKPLNPLLVYIDQENLRYSFEKAFKERPTAWSDVFIDYYTANGYGKAYGLSGFEGTLEVLEARKSFEAEIVDQLDLNKIKVDNSSYNRELYKELLSAQLKAALLQNS